MEKSTAGKGLVREEKWAGLGLEMAWPGLGAWIGLCCGFGAEEEWVGLGFGLARLQNGRAWVLAWHGVAWRGVRDGPGEGLLLHDTRGRMRGRRGGKINGTGQKRWEGSRAVFVGRARSAEIVSQKESLRSIS